MKGLFKGIKHLFGSAQKEHEMEIGFPTDVKHVAHVGFDNLHGTSPSWMNNYKASPDYFASGSFSHLDSTSNSWASLDFEQRGLQPAAAADPPGTVPEHPCPELPRAPKRPKKKKEKVKSPSPTRSSAASTDSYSTAMEDVGDQMRGTFRIYIN
ncbi:hypothetical protein ZIOFF_011461 [Zingiber officinale]|uniref:CRIB domain-containing protein n=2 Tax=Zingiber officinale TaxID=94328 RepID=A0A8J5M142_ZINOF|nr:hypothetical protein ZIOFF_011461 [Zingiber officinale]